MLLRGLSWLVAFQLVGTALNVLFFPSLARPYYWFGTVVYLPAIQWPSE